MAFLSFRPGPCGAALVLLLAAACGRGGKGAGPLQVMPAAPRTVTGGRLMLTALTGGQVRRDVVWRVLEPEGGIILSGGAYLAPQVPGTYTVVVQDAHRPGIQTRREVRVELQGAPLGSPRNAEILDPRTGMSTPAGAMRFDRVGHTATLLRDGTVLIVGDGRVERFDPRTLTFRVCLGGTSLAGTAGHCAVLMKDGRVFLAGPGNGGYRQGLAEIYDPEADRFEVLGPSLAPGEILALKDGRIVMAGREGVQVYDPVRKVLLKATGEQVAGCEGQRITELDSGKVLLSGGAVLEGEAWMPRRRLLVLDPGTLEVVSRGQLPSPRWGHFIQAMSGRQLWILGGQDPGQVPPAPVLGVDRFQQSDWECTAGSPLSGPLPAAPGVLLPDGRWLLAGGPSTLEPSAATFLARLPEGAVESGPPLSMKRGGHTLTVLADGRVLIAGGVPEPQAGAGGAIQGAASPSKGNP